MSKSCSSPITSAFVFPLFVKTNLYFLAIKLSRHFCSYAIIFTPELGTQFTVHEGSEGALFFKHILRTSVKFIRYAACNAFTATALNTVCTTISSPSISSSQSDASSQLMQSRSQSSPAIPWQMRIQSRQNIPNLRKKNIMNFYTSK